MKAFMIVTATLFGLVLLAIVLPLLVKWIRGTNISISADGRKKFLSVLGTILKWGVVVTLVVLGFRACMNSEALKARQQLQTMQAEAKKQWILEHDLPEGSMFARTAEVVGLSDTPEALEFRTRFPHQGDEAGSAHFLWIRKNRYGTWQHVGANVSGEFWFTKISDNHYEGWTKRNGGELGEVPTRLIRR